MQNEDYAAVSFHEHKGRKPEKFRMTCQKILSGFVIAKQIPTKNPASVVEKDSVFGFAAEISDKCIRNHPI